MNTIDVGKKGEQIVQQFLVSRGYMIIAQRWHCLHGEIDIVARHRKTPKQIIFVEVKTFHKKEAHYFSTITVKKRRAWHRAAMEYCVEHDLHSEDVPIFIVIFCFLTPDISIEYYYLPSLTNSKI